MIFLILPGGSNPWVWASQEPALHRCFLASDYDVKTMIWCHWYAVEIESPMIPIRPITETRMPSHVYLYHSTTSKTHVFFLRERTLSHLSLLHSPFCSTMPDEFKVQILDVNVKHYRRWHWKKVCRQTEDGTGVRGTLKIHVKTIPVFLTCSLIP